MTDAARIPRLAGFKNSRDLGGRPTIAGARTRFGSVIRSNTPAALSPTERTAVFEVGMTSVIDLRSAAELAVVPHPLARAACYLHRPLVDERSDSAREYTPERALGDIYAGSLSRNATTIAAVMTAIAAAPPGPIMICCAAGRDRTGMIAALLLDLAGATRAAIGLDYAMTDIAQCDVRVEQPTAAGATAPVPQSSALNSAARPIDQMLDRVSVHFGGPQAYLAWLGLASAQIDSLTHRLA